MKKIGKILLICTIALMIIGIFAGSEPEQVKAEKQTVNIESEKKENLLKNRELKEKKLKEQKSKEKKKPKKKKSKEKKESKKVNSKNKQKKEVEKFEDSLVYAKLGLAWKYAEEKKIKTPNFKERNKVCRFIKEDSGEKIAKNFVYLKPFYKVHLTREDTVKYERTLEETKLLYYGSLNDDSEPDGLGVIFEMYDDFNDLDPELFVRYLGYFKNGMYDGYGVELNITSMDDVPMKISTEAIEKNMAWFNGMVAYEGYFKKGEYSGTGVQYISNLYAVLIEEGTEEAIDPKNLEYSYDIGDYKKGTWNGKIKSYISGKLFYEGDTKNGEFDGKGKLYDTVTGKLRYKGEFVKSEYDGKGTLYDENGNIIHKGKFKAGDVD